MACCRQINGAFFPGGDHRPKRGASNCIVTNASPDGSSSLTSWACPPAVGTVEECRAKCLAYPNILVFSAKYDLEDSFDFEGMQAGMRAFKTVCTRLDETAQKHLSRFMLLSNESCGRCEKCTYPDAPCRFPQKAKRSMEACGIDVVSLSKSCGINYTNGANTVTYFSVIYF